MRYTGSSTCMTMRGEKIVTCACSWLRVLSGWGGYFPPPKAARIFAVLKLVDWVTSIYSLRTSLFAKMRPPLPGASAESSPARDGRWGARGGVGVALSARIPLGGGRSLRPNHGRG